MGEEGGGGPYIDWTATQGAAAAAAAAAAVAYKRFVGWRRRGGSTTTEASWGGRIEAGTNAIIRKREKRKNGKKVFCSPFPGLTNGFMQQRKRRIMPNRSHSENLGRRSFRRNSSWSQGSILRFLLLLPGLKPKVFSCWRSKSFEAREGRRVTLQEKF